MAKTRSNGGAKKAGSSSPLMVRLDDESKAYLVQAAKLRRMSVSDYVRTVTVPQAQKEVHAAREQTISLTAEEQLAFWNSAPRRTAPADRRPAATRRGHAG